MRVRLTAAARTATALATALGLAACGIANAAKTSVAHKDSLVIGVYGNQPSLAFQQGQDFDGFDVDVARYVARRLGVPDQHIRFKAVTNSQRESVLRTGQADLVVSTYSITPQRKTEITFAGPYYVAHQDTLVRAGDITVNNVRDLKGRRLCQVTGSVSWKRVTEQRKIAASLVPATSYLDCVNKLVGGSVDAVSTDDLILAGFAGQQGRSVRIVNAPFSDERYGVGIRKDDVDGCEAVNKAITEMYQDGTATRLLSRWFGATGLKLTTTVPQFEGCS